MQVRLREKGRFTAAPTHDTNGEPIVKLCCACGQRPRLGQRPYCRECHRDHQNTWVKTQRATGAYLIKGILRASRYNDKKRGHANDLNEVFVRSLIEFGCTYCGDTTNRMTVDRIDNSLGHLKTNVVAACKRCNLVRGNMPYDAWLCLVKGMRQARERGLFGNWMARW